MNGIAEANNCIADPDEGHPLVNPAFLLALAPQHVAVERVKDGDRVIQPVLAEEEEASHFPNSLGRPVSRGCDISGLLELR